MVSLKFYLLSMFYRAWVVIKTGLVFAFLYGEYKIQFWMILVNGRVFFWYICCIFFMELQMLSFPLFLNITFKSFPTHTKSNVLFLVL